MTVTAYHFDWEGSAWVRLMAMSDAGKIVAYIVCDKEKADNAEKSLEYILKPKEERDAGR